MSGLSQYQSVFRVAKHDATSTAAPEPQAIKRNRQVASCTPCRIRKCVSLGILDLVIENSLTLQAKV